VATVWEPGRVSTRWVMAVAVLGIGGLVRIGATEPLATEFARAAGQKAPASNDAMRAAFDGPLPVLVDFTGDGGPDRIKQDLVLEEIRAEFEGRIAIVEVTDETRDGDVVFDAYRVTKIPSLCVVSADGTIVACYEGFVDADPLREAVRLALVAGGGAPEVIADDLPAEHSAPTATPAARGMPAHRLVGRGLPPMGEAVGEAVAAGVPVLIFFHGSWGKYSRRQATIIQDLASTVGRNARIATFEDGIDGDAPAFEACGVSAVPTILVVDAEGRVASVYTRVVELDELRQGLLPGSSAARVAETVTETTTPSEEAREIAADAHPLIGKPAPPGTEILSHALKSNRPTALFFQRSAHAEEQAMLLREMKHWLAERADVITIRDETPEEQRAWQAYEVTDTPVLFLINGDGIVVTVVPVDGAGDALRARIDELIR